MRFLGKRGVVSSLAFLQKRDLCCLVLLCGMPSSFLRSPSFFRNYYCGKLTSFSQIRQSEKKVGKNGAKGVGIKPSYLEEAEKKEN